MDKQIAYIPFSKINRVQIYINKNKKSLAQIKKDTGADYIINGGLYNPNWTPCCHLKADGNVYAKDKYKYWGFGWNNGSDITMTSNYTDFKNYICCTALIVNGTAVQKPIYAKEQGGKRGRTAIGIKGNNLCLYVSRDGTMNAKNPEGLRDELFGLGLNNAIMLDSGGSSQCNMNGNIVYSSRVVQNLILVHLHKDKSEQPVKKDDISNAKDNGNKIIKKYMTNNPCYKNNIKTMKTKAMLHSTGTPGAKAENIYSVWDKSTAQAGVEFVIDDTGIYQTLPLGIKSWHGGGVSNSTHVACEICEPIQTRVLRVNWLPLYKGGKNNTAYAVKLLQSELVAGGYDPKGIDGSFGSGCEAALKSFQKNNGLVVDGICGKNTLSALQKRNGSYLEYPVQDVSGYFNNVYNKAVWLFAYIMKEIGGKPEEIVCHSEGYEKGIASNHADVMHWFPVHGKSMDTFREDVKKAMNGNYDYNNTVIKDEVVNDPVTTSPNIDKEENKYGASDWSLLSVEKAVNKGLIKGDNKGNYKLKDNVTMEQMIVVLDRLGLL